MKYFLIFLICFAAQFSWAEGTKSISGKIILAEDLKKELVPTGALFIFAKKATGKMADGTPPLAVLRIPNPQFPFEFSLSAENAMMAGTPFEGPFAVYARYAPSGDALDKTGPSGTASQKKIKLGQKNISVTLKK